MTAVKTATSAPQRPESALDCIRCAMRGSSPGNADSWDQYCRRIVDRALMRLQDRGFEPQVLEAIMAHVARTGSVSGFRLCELVAVTPRFSVVDQRPADQGAMWLHTLVRIAWHAARKTVEAELMSAPGFRQQPAETSTSSAA